MPDLTSSIAERLAARAAGSWIRVIGGNRYRCLSDDDLQRYANALMRREVPHGPHPIMVVDGQYYFDEGPA